MNSILAQIDKRVASAGTVVLSAGQFSDGAVTVAVERISVLRSQSLPLYYEPSRQVLVCALGYLSNISDLKERHRITSFYDVEVVFAAYLEAGIDTLRSTDGRFAILIYDRPRKRLDIVQPEYGSILPIYYTETSTHFIIGTSLRKVLASRDAEDMLDYRAARAFLCNGHIVPNRRTLLASVSNLTPGHNLTLDCGKMRVTQVRFARKCPAVSSRETAINDLLPSVEHTLCSLLKDRNSTSAAITLTSGWDSNLLLHFLLRSGERDVVALTIDGGPSVDEVPAAQKILPAFRTSTVRHLTRAVDQKTLDSLPDIVSRYEGYVFDTGMLLRYELAKLLNQECISSVILGSAADHIIDPCKRTVLFSRIDTSSEAVRTCLSRILKSSPLWAVANAAGVCSDPQERLRFRIGGSFYWDHYNTFLENNLQMHEIMLNSFGVHGFYPFVNARTFANARALGKVNRNKRLYREMVGKELPKDVAQCVSKSGNAVDLMELLKDRMECLVQVLEKRVAKRLLTYGQRMAIARAPTQYPVLLLQLAYLHVFTQIFVFDRRIHATHAAAQSMLLAEMLADAR